MADQKDQKGKKKEVVSIKIETARTGLSSKLNQKYKAEVVPALMKKFQYSNVMQVPKIIKVVVNRGVGEATVDVKILDKCLEELFLITHQKPFIRKAKKSIANFKLRKGQPIGVMTTLRGARMYHFLEKLIEVALPRIRDFKGLSPHSFDGRGNYTFGIREQLIFTEIDYNKVDKIRGMNVSIITTAENDESAKALLEAYGLPFRN